MVHYAQLTEIILGVKSMFGNVIAQVSEYMVPSVRAREDSGFDQPWGLRWEIVDIWSADAKKPGNFDSFDTDWDVPAGQGGVPSKTFYTVGQESIVSNRFIDRPISSSSSPGCLP
jgi:hypothetical protein